LLFTAFIATFDLATFGAKCGIAGDFTTARSSFEQAAFATFLSAFYFATFIATFNLATLTTQRSNGLGFSRGIYGFSFVLSGRFLVTGNPGTGHDDD
jgi:hypothetical protein